ncbi:hypothetical protein MKK64_27310 [Methylobacterium sp. E-025]|uniref:hypothetical protein n=1 Tax=Methylobacterium sp. E-025 TaxID=2836561 RepID=UPI001FBC0719|nr:hypothetical protein [Methylobacterium sp. E-025]MCJ2114873.1 hypothetical protein [Methylobacterium sp. E-025]
MLIASIIADLASSLVSTVRAAPAGDRPEEMESPPAARRPQASPTMVNERLPRSVRRVNEAATIEQS